MRPPHQWSGRLGVVGLLIAAALTANGQPAPDAEPRERYRVLVERNIFSRSRRAPQGPPPPVSTRPAAVVDTDQYLVLTGAGKGDSEIAFIEDTRTGRTTRLRTGDAVGKGKIVTITLRHIEYEREGQIVKIEIGSNLAGSTVSAAAIGPSTQPAEAADGAGPATDEAPPPNAAPGGANSVLEQMRRRRQQQTDR